MVVVFVMFVIVPGLDPPYGRRLGAAPVGQSWEVHDRPRYGVCESGRDAGVGVGARRCDGSA